MTELLEWITRNPWFSIVSLIIGVIGVLITAYGLLGIRRRLPRYAVESNNLITKWKHEVPVRIHFDGHGDPIEDLTVSKVRFWNAGRQSIRKNDVPKDEPLILAIGGDGIILSAEIIKRTTPSNRFEIGRFQDKKRVGISFEFMDHRDGITIQIFHTGDKGNDLSLMGRIIEGGQPVRIKAAKPFRTKVDAIVTATVLILSPIVLAVIVFITPTDPQPVPPAETTVPIPKWIAMLFPIVAAPFCWGASYKLLHRNIPPQLDD